MKTLGKIILFHPTTSYETKNILISANSFLKAVGYKDAATLQKILDGDAEIQLISQPGKILNKQEYIKFVTAEASASYRTDFCITDGQVELYEDQALIKGTFSFLRVPNIKRLIWIRLAKNNKSWSVKRVFYP